MELAAWISGRERAALRGVRLYGLCLCGALLAAAGWLGWREARLDLGRRARQLEREGPQPLGAQRRLAAGGRSAHALASGALIL